MIYGVLPEEYNCFGFSKLNDKGKREYVTDLSRYAIYDACNNSEFLYFFENKFETYRMFKDFYHREALLFNEATSFVELKEFVTKHRKFICKPLKLWLGVGVEILNNNDYKSVEDLRDYLVKKGECILEELIVQSSELGIFHPASVNTIRVPAFNTKKGVIIHRPFIKFGQGDSIVDNGGQGGILIAVDSSSGVLISEGIDEKGKVYLKHPDSNITFPGYQLPDWKQVEVIISQCMNKVPNVKYVGWDLAHTNDGWVIVEGNHTGQFVGQQMPRHTGCAKEIKDILKSV